MNVELGRIRTEAVVHVATIPELTRKVLRKTTKTCVSIGGMPVHIGTRHLSNTILHYYSYSNSFGTYEYSKTVVKIIKFETPLTHVHGTYNTQVSYHEKNKGER